MPAHHHLLQGSRDPAALEPLVTLAERALRTWEPCWTPFLPPDLREEVEARLATLSELRFLSEGGHPGAERRRLLLWRGEAAPQWPLPALTGLEIAGNFLFDPAAPEEFRAALLAMGAPEADLGDLWQRGDRGARAILTAPLAAALDGREGQVRSVPVRCEAKPLEALQPPPPRTPRRLTTVEASRRLDAVASAGFALSRSRMAELIRQGAVRIDWQPVSSPSRELRGGERVQLRDRGELEILAIEPTKRERLRIALERR
jgi:photosystem II S4 domain protein